MRGRRGPDARPDDGAHGQARPLHRSRTVRQHRRRRPHALALAHGRPGRRCPGAIGPAGFGLAIRRPIDRDAGTRRRSPRHRTTSSRSPRAPARPSARASSPPAVRTSSTRSRRCGWRSSGCPTARRWSMRCAPPPASSASSATRSAPPRRCRATRVRRAVVAAADRLGPGLRHRPPVRLGGRGRPRHRRRRRRMPISPGSSWRASACSPAATRTSTRTATARRWRGSSPPSRQRSRDRRHRVRRREGHAGHRPRCRRAGPGQRHHRGRRLGGRPRRGRDQHVVQQPGLQRRPAGGDRLRVGSRRRRGRRDRQRWLEQRDLPGRGSRRGRRLEHRTSPTSSTRTRTTAPTPSSGRRGRGSGRSPPAEAP